MKTQLTPISHTQPINNPIDDSLSFSNDILSPGREINPQSNSDRQKRRSLSGLQQTTDVEKQNYSEPDNFTFKPAGTDKKNLPNVGPFDFRQSPRHESSLYGLMDFKEELKAKTKLIEELNNQISEQNQKIYSLEVLNKQLQTENKQLTQQVFSQANIIMQTQKQSNVEQILQTIDNVANENNQLKLLLNTRLNEITDLKIQVSQTQQSVESIQQYKQEHEILISVQNQMKTQNLNLEKEIIFQKQKLLQLEQNFANTLEKNKNLELEMLNWKHKYSILKEAYTSHQISPLKQQCEQAKPVGIILQSKYFH